MTRFIRSACWGTWSLVLTTRHLGERQRILAGITGQKPSPSTIEIDLEPAGGWNRSSADERERIVRINVRRHCTPRTADDIVATELPMATRRALDTHLGVDLAAWLLDPVTEILGMIDWRRFEAVSDGGAALLDCAHARHAHLIPGTRPCDAFGRIADALGRGELRAA